jgi:hypothetical protein
MARVTDAQVQEIISLNVLTSTDPFITTANLLVTQHLGSSGLSAAILAQIEKYLAAHLVALHPDERQLTEQKLGEATDKYAGKFGDQLHFTQFGQTVTMLDSTGILAGIGGDTVEIDTITVDNE